MVDYTKAFGPEAGATAAADSSRAMASVFNYVYSWMAAGLGLSALVAWWTVKSGLYRQVLTGGGLILCLVAEVVLVLVLVWAINKIPPMVATVMFMVYAAVNGLTLSVVLLAYAQGTVVMAFLTCAALFGSMALYGSVTKKDLTGLGSLCFWAVVGLVLAGLVELICARWMSNGVFSMIDYGISAVGVLVFVGLTAWDAQKVKLLAARSGTLDGETVRKLGILGALSLYLDFINMFLYLLRLFGNRRD